MNVLGQDDIEIDRKLGDGGYGEVHLAKTKKWGLVAIKNPKIDPDNPLYKEFHKEAEILSKMRSQEIINFYGLIEFKNTQYIMMEYAPNGTLLKHLCYLREKNLESSFSWDKRYQIALDITRGLNYIHSERVLHRDMKSSNILLFGDSRAKISDFGLSKIKIENNQTFSALYVTNNVEGTIRWKAPETYEDDRYTDKADIYSLGIIFWEIASCQFPYAELKNSAVIIKVLKGERLEIPSTCPREFKDLIELCWSHDPIQRPRSLDVLNLITKINEDYSKADKKEEVDPKQKENDEKFGNWKSTKEPDFEGSIFEAAAKGKRTNIIYFLENGSNINEKYLKDDRYDGWLLKNSTPLHFSSIYGHLSVVEYLINQKADINAKNIDDQTPLHYAAYNGHLSVVEYLVNQKADINSKTTSVEFLYLIILLFIMLLLMVILVLLNI